jgi:hypothetical protein
MNARMIEEALRFAETACTSQEGQEIVETIRDATQRLRAALEAPEDEEVLQ